MAGEEAMDGESTGEAKEEATEEAKEEAARRLVPEEAAKREREFVSTQLEAKEEATRNLLAKEKAKRERDFVSTQVASTQCDGCKVPLQLFTAERAVACDMCGKDTTPALGPGQCPECYRVHCAKCLHIIMAASSAADP